MRVTPPGSAGVPPPYPYRGVSRTAPTVAENLHAPGRRAIRLSGCRIYSSFPHRQLQNSVCPTPPFPRNPQSGTLLCGLPRVKLSNAPISRDIATLDGGGICDIKPTSRHRGRLRNGADRQNSLSLRACPEHVEGERVRACPELVEGEIHTRRHRHAYI